jgi:hypothetical protein
LAELSPEVCSTIATYQRLPNGHIRVRFHNKLRALKLLAQYQGLIDDMPASSSVTLPGADQQKTRPHATHPQLNQTFQNLRSARINE